MMKLAVAMLIHFELLSLNRCCLSQYLRNLAHAYKNLAFKGHDTYSVNLQA